MKTPAIDHLYSAAMTYGQVAEEVLDGVDDLSAGLPVCPSYMDTVAAGLTAAADALVKAAKDVGFATAFAAGYDAGFENGNAQGYENGQFSGYDAGYDAGYEAHREAEG